MRGGRFGSTTARRTRWVVKVLAGRFGQEALLSVPGFSRNKWGRLSFTLTGDYALIPYFDADMWVATVEGRYAGDGEGMGKYVSLRNSVPHLYVFPGIMPERLEAFCEGPVGAIVAAQEGIPVGAIKGHRNYKMPGSAGGPLPELEGVDFKGRLVPYIPDLDVKPKTREAVLSDAPKAAHHLAALHNGRAALVALQEGKDLDEWLLSMKKGERHAAFTDLMTRAIPLEDLPAEGESSREQERTPSRVPAEPDGVHANYDHWAEDLPPEGLATRGELGAALAAAALVFACVLFALLGLLPPATLPGAVAGHPFPVACAAGLVVGAWLWSKKRRMRLKTARHLRD